MKKFLLCVVATAVVAVSCTKEDSKEQTKFDRINFNAGLSTKAPIDGVIPGVALAGVQLLRAPDGAAAVWTGVNSVATTAAIAISGVVTPTIAQYYNANQAQAWFMAYYPVATAIAADKVSWTITGQEDIIVAPSVGAGNKSVPTDVVLAFAHKLSQIKFRVIATDAAAITAWGTVTNILVNAKTALELQPSTATFSVASSSPSADLIAGGASYPITLLTTAQAAGNVMVFPGAIATVAVKIQTSKGLEQTITISSLPNLVAGSSHEITLTFTATSITFSAQLSDWVAGTSGSGTVI